MNTTTRRRTLVWSLPALAFLASPSLAQMHPERIAELEEQVSELTEQLGEISAELEEAKNAEALDGHRKDEESNKVAIQSTH